MKKKNFPRLALGLTMLLALLIFQGSESEHCSEDECLSEQQGMLHLYNTDEKCWAGCVFVCSTSNNTFLRLINPGAEVDFPVDPGLYKVYVQYRTDQSIIVPSCIKHYAIVVEPGGYSQLILDECRN